MIRPPRSPLLLVVFLSLFASALPAQEPGDRPLAVSPGDETAVDLCQSCPTFSWSAVSGAGAYRVAIFAAADTYLKSFTEMEAAAAPLVIREIAGPALSWTLPSDSSLAVGDVYAWYVQALDGYGQELGNWSEGRLFRVRQPLSWIGIAARPNAIAPGQKAGDVTETGVVSDLETATPEVSLQETGAGDASGRAPNQGSETTYNTIYGLNAGDVILGSGGTGTLNSFFGFLSGRKNSSGDNNSFFGAGSGESNTTGRFNSIFGYWSGYNLTTGLKNSFFGANAGLNHSSGENNTFVGYSSGYCNTFGSGNVFLGYLAGQLELGSNRLYIANSAAPLIYGEFDNALVRINGNFQATGYLSLNGGTTQISAAELNLLDGKTLANGTANNSQLATRGYVDDNKGLGSSGLTDTYLTKWDGSKLANSLLVDSGTTVSVNGNLTATGNLSTSANLTGSGYLSLNGGATRISAAELNLLDGKTLATGGTTGNDMLATRGYVDASDDVGLIGTGLTATTVTKWDGTKLADSLLSESSGAVRVNGRLGIGTAAPTASLDVVNAANATLVLNRTGGPTAFVSAGEAYADIGTSTQHSLRFLIANQWRMRLNVNGTMTFSNGAKLTAGGVWTNASSRALKENIESLTSDEAATTLSGLDPVKYNYKADRTDRHVGFIAEDVPDLVASADRQGLSPMDIVAVLTKVVQEQQKTIEEQKREFVAQKRIIEDLATRLSRLEQNSR
jgi:hypothetical protein